MCLSREVIRTKNLFSVIDLKMHWQSSGEHLCVKVDRYNRAKKEKDDTIKYVVRGIPPSLPPDPAAISDGGYVVVWVLNVWNVLITCFGGESAHKYCWPVRLQVRSESRVPH